MNRRVFISGGIGTVLIGGITALSLWRPEPAAKKEKGPLTVSSAPMPGQEHQRNDANDAIPARPDPAHENRPGSWISFDGVDNIPLITSGSFGGALEVPEPAKAGLYSNGAKVGAAKGSAIVAAHVDNVDGSPAAFAKLHELVPGSVIIVSDAGKQHRYKAVSVRLYEQDELPVTLFDLAGPHLLHLVTCAGESVESDGPWRYRFNLIVTATPL